MKEFFECYDDPRVVELGKKTDVYTDPEIDAVFPTKIGTRLEILTKNGEHYELYEEDKPRILNSFIKEKFTVFASMQLPLNKVEKIISMVEDLEKLDDVNELSPFFK
ncbi:hypothetical protein GF326_07315 [Candidatus Bathyarchaeota archaeon]|nr:hypothetical protein [Candidatus Bathyarchaeota archaeon]